MGEGGKNDTDEDGRRRDSYQPRYTGSAVPAPRLIRVSDRMQSDYSYALTQPEGQNFDPLFQPELNPKEMLTLGVFGGCYLTDCRAEFPANWFTEAKLSPGKPQKILNHFGVMAGQPLSVWRKKGWIHPADPRGWFQWYCRYWRGRRLPQEDDRQIKRWRAIRRHLAQIVRNCPAGDLSCRPRQRQAVLQWAYDSRKI